jgi:hypothetical protein
MMRKALIMPVALGCVALTVVLVGGGWLAQRFLSPAPCPETIDPTLVRPDVPPGPDPEEVSPTPMTDEDPDHKDADDRVTPAEVPDGKDPNAVIPDEPEDSCVPKDGCDPAPLTPPDYFPDFPEVIPLPCVDPWIIPV